MLPCPRGVAGLLLMFGFCIAGFKTLPPPMFLFLFLTGVTLFYLSQTWGCS